MLIERAVCTATHKVIPKGTIFQIVYTLSPFERNVYIRVEGNSHFSTLSARPHANAALHIDALVFTQMVSPSEYSLFYLAYSETEYHRNEATLETAFGYGSMRKAIIAIADTKSKQRRGRKLYVVEYAPHTKKVEQTTYFSDVWWHNLRSLKRISVKPSSIPALIRDDILFTHSIKGLKTENVREAYQNGLTLLHVRDEYYFSTDHDSTLFKVMFPDIEVTEINA